MEVMPLVTQLRTWTAQWKCMQVQETAGNLGQLTQHAAADPYKIIYIFSFGNIGIFNRW